MLYEKDIIGKKFNKLKVIKAFHKNGRLYCKCKCECENEIIVRYDSLTSGTTKSCGCLVTDVNAKNIKGKRSGRLVAKKQLDKREHGSIVWLCKCDCGNYCEVPAQQFDKVKSCGCLTIDKAKINRVKATEKFLDKYIKDDTNLALINKKKPIKSNTSGVTGVTYDKSRGKWVAQIVFQGKGHTLGRFKDKEEAIKVRKEAEKKYFKPILDKYKNKE